MMTTLSYFWFVDTDLQHEHQQKQHNHHHHHDIWFRGGWSKWVIVKMLVKICCCSSAVSTFYNWCAENLTSHTYGDDNRFLHKMWFSTVQLTNCFGQIFSSHIMSYVVGYHNRFLVLSSLFLVGRVQRAPMIPCGSKAAGCCSKQASKQDSWFIS